MQIKYSESLKQQNLILFANQDNDVWASEKWRKQNSNTYRFVVNYLKTASVQNNDASILQTYSPELKQLIIVRLNFGKEPPSYLSLGGQLGKTVLKMKMDQVSILLPDNTGKNKVLFEALPLVMEGMFLGCYVFEEYKSDPDSKKSELKTITFISKRTAALSKAINNAEICASSTNMARNWSNQPGNLLTPLQFKQECQKVAKEAGLKFEALTENQMKKLKMGCLLGVGQGSINDSFLNCLRYTTKKKNAPTLMLVGKGITFDSGGISIKPSAGMELMKHDMSGGAAVLGAMRCIGLTKPDVNVVGLIPAVENLPGGKAFRPGDVLTACNGKTVEIFSTDAEGRLILADALAYGIKKYQPNAVVDIATLTGSCVVALGHFNTGMVSNRQHVADQMIAAGKQTEEPVWQMPNDKTYSKAIKSKIADLKNSTGRDAGMIYAGKFIECFVEDTPWAHLDIAGTAYGVKDISVQPDDGATGVGVRLLARFVANWKE